MIRVFKQLCKLNYLHISAIDLFNEYMLNFKPNDYKCPHCQVVHPDWKRHAVYERYLISYENRNTITYQITIIRCKCSSCGHTHAILPDCIIPYQSYSLLFILAVMRDYFISSLSVEAICVKYDISVSTLYTWKKLFLIHKKIWLGLLYDACISSSKFLDLLFEQNLLHNLKDFFHMAGVSFLQSTSHMKKAHSPPA